MRSSILTVLAVALAIPAGAANRTKADACSVVEAPFEYAGKIVEVSGIYVGDLEQSYLTGRACASQHIVIPNRFDASSLSRLASGRLVVFRGMVRLMPKQSGSKHVVPWLDNPVLLSPANQ